MKKFLTFFVLALGLVILLGADEPSFPPMPAAVSGNAVASLKGGFELFSFMGVGPKKSWDDVTNQVYIMTFSHAGKWSLGRPVPGVAGRLNAAAGGAKGLVVLMGGYVVDNQGGEIIVPDVNVYEPGARRWSRGGGDGRGSGHWGGHGHVVASVTRCTGRRPLTEWPRE